MCYPRPEAKSMKPMWGRAPLLAAAAVVVFLGAGSLDAQERVNDVRVYEREIFQYSAAGRPDPFRSLLNDEELGIRVEDLTLRGVIYNQDPSMSVAVLSQAGSDRRIRARVGERVGSLRILGIFPDRVDIVVEELGVSRRETLRIVRAERGDQP